MDVEVWFCSKIFTYSNVRAECDWEKGFKEIICECDCNEAVEEHVLRDVSLWDLLHWIQAFLHKPCKRETKKRDRRRKRKTRGGSSSDRGRREATVTVTVNRHVEVGRLSQIKARDFQVKHTRYCSQVSPPSSNLQQTESHVPDHIPPVNYIGENVSRKDKAKYLYTTLLEVNNSKEAIYGALDAWVAWEQNFPIASLKSILNSLEKEQQWHRVVQVIKWMLSKGQGTTMGTYGQLIRALDMDHRVEEAQKFWEMKIGADLHSVPWQLCHLMISVYYRNNMLEDLVKLFKGLEAFHRKPRDKSIIQKVLNAYEMLGLVKEKERVLEKYSYLYTEEGPKKKRGGKHTYLSSEKGQQRQSRKASSQEK
ncbi:hypothetical protein RJT34_05462 [Clitoria ternatea]|uniref:Pentatricopeptide repeat-containing protein n=1 Tax=Clitoria ternatea TaxID=43366 RepID=A0AAN9K0N5_CLITE